MKYIFLISIILYVVTFILKTNKSLQMLQQNRYNRGNKYLKWLKDNLSRNYLTIDLIFFSIFFFVSFRNVVLCLVFNTIYFIISFVLLRQMRKEQKKLPLKYTGRIIRLYITTCFIYLIPIILLCIFFNENNLLVYYSLLFLMEYLNNIIVVLANIINVPIEKIIGNHFKKRALNKLNSMTNMDVIGITGSYGKTSSKNIVNDILNVKYNAFKTPQNYNTPFGLMITINNYLDKFNDYFIAEMGACRVGEIKELCDLVHPKYGIITKIGVAHLETFGSEENIIKTKFELIESLPSDGIGILNADDPKQVGYKIKNDCKIVWIGIDNKNAFVNATNIKLTKEGTVFDCKFKGDKKTYQFETKLLGNANVYNILAGIALGYNLGIGIDDLIKGVKKITPVEHRLELKRYYDMYMIDDCYNANPEGCKMALDVLKMMKGNKIVISSGMIELGNKSYELNYELGCYMADVCDYVILIGEEQTKPIVDGLKKKKFKDDKIYVLNNIMNAFDLIHALKDKETYILLQSDLPDIFNEK
ncbi:MAG: UDP-N-acetylmuramoyl-tripeptide--D-alanyl-D-alanine ligase [Bacilli bacterium]